MRDTETVEWIAVTTASADEINTTTDEAEPVEVLALVAGRSSAESNDNERPAVVASLTLYLLDATVTPGPSDRFTVAGRSYDVDGTPKFWGASGVEVTVTRTEVRE